MADAATDISAVGSGAAKGFVYGGPVGAAIGALAALPTLFQTSLAGVQKEDATTVVNALAPVFEENVKLFLANPTAATQQQAISNFMAFWLNMSQHVQALGRAGTAAVNDRAPGGKFDWWKLYLDPIQNYKFPSGLSAIGGKAVPGVNTDVPVASPESKPSNLTGGPTMAQLQAFAGDKATLLQTQWNWYYSNLSGVHQTLAGTPGQLTVQQYYATRQKAGLPIGSSAASQPTGAETSNTGVTGTHPGYAGSGYTGGYGGFIAFVLVAALLIWMKVH